MNIFNNVLVWIIVIFLVGSIFGYFLKTLQIKIKRQDKADEFLDRAEDQLGIENPEDN